MPATQTATMKVKGAAEFARPAVTRLAKDDRFKQHVAKAYGSAHTIYDELFAGGPPATESTARRIATRLATDTDLQEELRNVFVELRDAGRRARKAARPSHTKRNALILAGIIIGILYNPATGADTRRWLKEKIFGPEETFEYETS
jgi:hypothetical protein